MTSSPPPDSNAPAPRQIAETLAECPVRAVTPVRGGANNRVYRVECEEGRLFALKSYFRQANDPRDRLGTEIAALGFLHRHGIKVVPEIIASDSDAGFALFEWIEGEAVTQPDDGDIDSTLALTAQLRGLGEASDATDLLLASEACLSGAEVERQVKARLDSLREPAAGEPELARFLEHDFVPALKKAVDDVREGYHREGLDFGRDIDPDKRTLSPSDFGFHNTLRQQDGKLVFVDFEYFGWDDPVKLTADFLHHPGMTLTEAQKVRFQAGTAKIFEADASFQARLALLYPIIGLRWCMILLNEFLPERLSRRRFAESVGSEQGLRVQQLNKARAQLGAVLNGMGGDMP